MAWYFQIVTLSLAGAAAGAALVAVWGATTRGYWFWRALAVWACLAAMLPIRAYEPALVFAISLPLTVLAIRGVQWVQGRGIREESEGSQRSSVVRFGLSDLLLATALLGLTLAVLIHISRKIPERTLPPRTVGEIVIPAVALSAVASLCWFVTSGRRRRWAALGLVVLVPALGWAIWPRTHWLYLLDSDFGLYYALGDLFGPPWRGYYVTVLGLAEFAMLLMAALVAQSLATSSWRVSKAFAVALYVSLVAAGLAMGALYVPMLWLTPFPPRVGSPDNHYARIMEIAQRVEAL